MLNLIEPLLKKRKLNFVRLDGSVPQKRRAELVHTFQTDPDCRLFLTTNAGSTGLNLQAANTVINVDLPWNPAVLEQRSCAALIAWGRSKPVRVYVLVSEQARLEESLLRHASRRRKTWLWRRSMPSPTVEQVDLVSGIPKIERPAGSAAGRKTGPKRASIKQFAANSRPQMIVQQFAEAHRERVAAAGGELLGAAFKMLGELIAPVEKTEPPPSLVADLRAGLGACVEENDGKPRLTITLPDRASLDNLAQTLAKLLAIGSSSSSAIGPVLAGRPSHRSVRAELPHTALTLDSDDQTALPDRDAGFWVWEASAPG